MHAADYELKMIGSQAFKSPQVRISHVRRALSPSAIERDLIFGVTGQGAAANGLFSRKTA